MFQRCVILPLLPFQYPKIRLGPYFQNNMASCYLPNNAKIHSNMSKRLKVELWVDLIDLIAWCISGIQLGSQEHVPAEKALEFIRRPFLPLRITVYTVVYTVIYCCIYRCIHGEPQGKKRLTDKLQRFFDWSVFLRPPLDTRYAPLN